MMLDKLGEHFNLIKPAIPDSVRYVNVYLRYGPALKGRKGKPLEELSAAFFRDSLDSEVMFHTAQSGHSLRAAVAYERIAGTNTFEPCAAFEAED